MNFLIPKASVHSLAELLEYLSRPCKNYSGNRAEDFKSCFDLTSKWCWMYADIMLRGLANRTLDYGERHHIIPFAFFSNNGYSSGRYTKYTTELNLAVLDYQEHVYAHYCCAKCSKVSIANKMAHAFYKMYSVGTKTGKLPDSAEVLKYITEADINMMKLKIPNVRQVSLEGRHHSWEVPMEVFRSEYHAAHRDERNIKSRRYHAEHKSECNARSRAYRQEHLDELREYDRNRNAARKDDRKIYNKKYHLEHREERLEYAKKYSAEHHDEIIAYMKTYNAKKANSPEAKEYRKQYNIDHAEHRNAYMKDYYADHKEERAEYKRKYMAEHGDEVRAKKKTEYAEKIAAGYKYRKDPVTGKRGWIFVGPNGIIPRKKKKRRMRLLKQNECIVTIATMK